MLGFVETHGRAETAALLEGLEQVPRRTIEYRGLTIEEMDLDAVLARHPQVAVVDEIAHTNAPGSRNKKRYQDVLELLDAGINVICAFNVQHLESLKDVVERATGVVIRETVPDSFLKQADQVVNLDLDAGGPARAAARRQDLRPRQGRVGARPTSSRRTSCRACASWRCARWPSGSTRTATRERTAATSRAAGDRADA